MHGAPSSTIRNSPTPELTGHSPAPPRLRMEEHARRAGPVIHRRQFPGRPPPGSPEAGKRRGSSERRWRYAVSSLCPPHPLNKSKEQAVCLSGCCVASGWKLPFEARKLHEHPATITLRAQGEKEQKDRARNNHSQNEPVQSVHSGGIAVRQHPGSVAPLLIDRS